MSTDHQSRSSSRFADWLFDYHKDWLRLDLIAGLTAATIVLPKAMAYATIAGLPIQVGLYTAFVFRPLSSEHPEDETFPGLVVFRIVGRMFFANTANIAEKMWQLIGTANPRVVVFDLSAVSDLEYTALKLLTEAANKLRVRGMSLWLAGLNPGVLRTIQRSSLGDVLGPGSLHFNVEIAAAKYLAEASKSEPTNLK